VVSAEAFTVEFGLLENLELVALSGKDVNMISIPELGQMSNLLHLECSRHPLTEQ
jgi:hypothetical protein